MRLFLAIDLGADARAALHDATASMRAEAPGLSWVAEPKLHLTLRFLGEQPSDTPSRIAAPMDAVAARHRPFEMRLRHVGAFPNFRRARVVWMGVEPAPRLELLHHDVELACETLGFGVEGRPFRPHVTLARVKGHPDVEVMRPLARMGKGIEFEREVLVERVDLMESMRSAGGSAYTRLHGSPLGGR